jgi:hypothetical protein
MRNWLRRLLLKIARRLTPQPDPAAENRVLKDVLSRVIERDAEEQRAREYGERVSELIEARQMAGSGPWRVSKGLIEETDALIMQAAERIKQGGTALRETQPISAAGATGDIALALQNVEWQRQINLSWLEFSRWGIQQIILISRLHYVKNPWIQRAINIVSSYVFGRGVEVMSEDDQANETLKDFFRRNQKVLGLSALSDLQKRCLYDGQIFFVFFSDTQSSGETNVRTIDATEIYEIVTDPDDTDKPWFYRRQWTQRIFDQRGGVTTTRSEEAWYPCLTWEPTPEQKAQQDINGKPIMWDNPVLHFKGGTGVSKWHFDCPKAYAAMDWAKAGRRWLEACATIRQALSQFAMTLTTKGGQQALEGAKQQLQTTVGPTSNLWDANPPTVTGGIFASGPGTQLQAFNTRGAGGDPKEAREYFSAVALVFGIPATMLGDMETANLATATTLDRPTELGMLEIQERWREVLILIATYVLNVSKGAADGRLVEKKDYRVIECSRLTLPNGNRIYTPRKVREALAKKNPSQEIIVKVNFPAIREGDQKMNIDAIVAAITLGTQSIIGIDERTAIGLLFEQLGVEDYGDILDQMFPPGEYDAKREKPEPATEPVPPTDKQAMTESIRRVTQLAEVLTNGRAR